MAYYLYIIYSKKLDRYYIGHTDNLLNRLGQHNSGLSAYTAKASDWHFCHTEEYQTRELAASREREIKLKKSRKYIEWLISSAG
jgi:putative endonuclease